MVQTEKPVSKSLTLFLFARKRRMARCASSMKLSWTSEPTTSFWPSCSWLRISPCSRLPTKPGTSSVCRTLWGQPEGLIVLLKYRSRCFSMTGLTYFNQRTLIKWMPFEVCLPVNERDRDRYSNKDNKRWKLKISMSIFCCYGYQEI